MRFLRCYIRVCTKLSFSLTNCHEDGPRRLSANMLNKEQQNPPHSCLSCSMRNERTAGHVPLVSWRTRTWRSFCRKRASCRLWGTRSPEPPGPARGPPDISLGRSVKFGHFLRLVFTPSAAFSEARSVVLPRPRVGCSSRRAQFSWSLQWAVWTNMWHTSRAVDPGETHTDRLWWSSPYTFINWEIKIL